MYMDKREMNSYTIFSLYTFHGPKGSACLRTVGREPCPCARAMKVGCDGTGATPTVALAARRPRKLAIWVDLRASSHERTPFLGLKVQTQSWRIVKVDEL